MLILWLRSRGDLRLLLPVAHHRRRLLLTFGSTITTPGSSLSPLWLSSGSPLSRPAMGTTQSQDSVSMGCSPASLLCLSILSADWLDSSSGSHGIPSSLRRRQADRGLPRHDSTPENVSLVSASKPSPSSPTLHHNLFFNQDHTYWLWSNANAIDLRRTEALLQHPDVVVIGDLIQA